jgi:hypothetical protein
MPIARIEEAQLAGCTRGARTTVAVDPGRVWRSSPREPFVSQVLDRKGNVGLAERLYGIRRGQGEQDKRSLIVFSSCCHSHGGESNE